MSHVNQNDNGFFCLKVKLPRISEVKSKEEVFLGPQIRDVSRDTAPDKALSEAEEQHGKHLKQRSQISSETSRLKIMSQSSKNCSIAINLLDAKYHHKFIFWTHIQNSS